MPTKCQACSRLWRYSNKQINQCTCPQPENLHSGGKTEINTQTEKFKECKMVWEKK